MPITLATASLLLRHPSLFIKFAKADEPMSTLRYVLGVVSILAIGAAALYGGGALAETLGLTNREGQSHPLTSDPAQSGDPGAVAPKGNWSVAEAGNFDGFPLLWAGDQYQGIPLTAIIRANYPYERGDLQVQEDSVSFLYGSCVIEGGEGGCIPPFTIMIQPYCKVPPYVIADMVKEGEPSALRGALAQTFTDGHIQLWTQNVTVTVFGPDRQSMRDLVQALRPLNSKAALAVDGALKPPEKIDCGPAPVAVPGAPTEP